MSSWNLNVAKLVMIGLLMGAQWSAAQDTKSDEETAVKLSPVKVEDGVAKISAENTAVEFVGAHVGDDPMPRLGGFREFSGHLKLNANGTAIEEIKVEFQIGSIWTEFDDLTSHLMNADFFEAEKFPTASFQSTSVKAGEEEGTVVVTGNLTMHGETKEISFSASPNVTAEGVTLSGKFNLDRTHFGMTKMTNGVEPVVSIRVNVGTPTKPRESAPSRRRGKQSSQSTTSFPGYVHVRLSLPEMF